MKIKAILILTGSLLLAACNTSAFYSQPSEIKQGDGVVYECNGEGSCYQVK